MKQEGASQTAPKSNIFAARARHA
jgi:hypothetical protein